MHSALTLYIKDKFFIYTVGDDMQNSIVEVYIASHKKIDFIVPVGYKIIQVNSEYLNEDWEGCIRDDDGENISTKNSSYCELTALYWAWKNSNADIKGLCHYRRFFSSVDKTELKRLIYFDQFQLKENILESKQIKKILDKYDLILPMPYLPYPLTEYEDLQIYCYKKDIDILISVIEEFYPEYKQDLDFVLDSKNLSHYNMMIANSNIFNNYCKWLFEVLEKVEVRCNIENYDTQHKRLYGYLSEMLLNVFVRHMNYNIKYFCVASPYQQCNLTKEVATKEMRRFSLLKKTNGTVFHKFLELFYKFHNEPMYKRYNQCKNYVNRSLKKKN